MSCVPRSFSADGLRYHNYVRARVPLAVRGALAETERPLPMLQVSSKVWSHTRTHSTFDQSDSETLTMPPFPSFPFRSFSRRSFHRISVNAQHRQDLNALSAVREAEKPITQRRQSSIVVIGQQGAEHNVMGVSDNRMPLAGDQRQNRRRSSWMIRAPFSSTVTEPLSPSTVSTVSRRRSSLVSSVRSSGKCLFFVCVHKFLCFQLLSSQVALSVQS